MVNSHDLESLQRATLEQHLHRLMDATEAYSPAPFTSFHPRKGEHWLQEGCVGVLVASGGQGSRLGTPLPKGCLPIGPKQKTLFESLVKKVHHASEVARRPLPLAIMTSQVNDEIIKRFFVEKKLFGLLPEQLFFFMQGDLPLLDEEGHSIEEAPGKLAVGPDGNGLSLHYFVQSGLFDTWRAAGVHTLQWLNIDNVLGKPFDPDFIDFHLQERNDLSLIGVKRVSPAEKMGLLVQKEGRIEVIEYSEAPPQIQESLALGNMGSYCFSFDLIAQLSPEDFPLHCQKRSVETSRGRFSVWKFEYFIFDALKKSQRSAVWEAPRALYFAPLKSSEDLPLIEKHMEDL